MKAVEYYISIALAVVALVLALLVYVTGRAGQTLQVQLNLQQEEINRGSLSQQVGANLLRDTAQIALGNPAMRELLQRNGITVTAAPAEGASAPAPAPAAAPTVPAKK